ncbi:MAG: hypothetical protein N2508_06110 [Anaerolineae bacterium]|nr:hypothetical protein [Anaerolineae bacterium]
MSVWQRYPRLWIVAIVSALVLLAAAGLWLRGTSSPDSHSPLPTLAWSSPLLNNATASPPPASWTNGGTALLWVALGILLAFGIAQLMLRWQRRLE